MRILQLGPYPPPQGGVQHNLKAIHEYLRRLGISSEVINITRHRKKEEGGVYYPRNWFQLLVLLLKLEHDIIHLHIGGRMTTRLLGLSLVCCLMPGSRAVLTFHSGGYSDSAGGRSASPRTLRGWILRRFDAVICVNEQMVELFRRFGLRSERIRLIPPFSLPEIGSSGDLPKHLSDFMENHDPLLCTVGLLEPEYDLPLQIELVGRLLGRYERLGLVIVGSGSLERMLREMVESKPFSDGILLCGDLPHDVTLRVMRDSDLLLRTTLYDGDSVAVRESLHLLTPVIATDNSMRPEGVHLVQAGDMHSLETAVQEELSRGKNAGEYNRADDTNIEKVVELYHGLVRDNLDV